MEVWISISPESAVQHTAQVLQGMLGSERLSSRGGEVQRTLEGHMVRGNAATKEPKPGQCGWKTGKGGCTGEGLVKV